MLIIFINFDNNNFIFYRESETLQTQLSAALRQIEPLKQVSNRQLVFQMGYICNKTASYNYYLVVFQMGYICNKTGQLQ